MSALQESRRLLLGLLVAGAVLLPGLVQDAGASPSESARDFIAEVLQNTRVSYEADRTSCSWSEHGTHALLAHVSKEGNKTRYDYIARGNQPAQTVIETEKSVFFINPGAQRISEARRVGDTEMDGIRLQLALKNYEWRFQPLKPKATNRRLVVATRSGDIYPTQRFWVAVPQKIVVRSERYGTRGELRSSWSLDDLHFKPDLPDSLFVPTDDPTIEIHAMPTPVRLTMGGTQPALGFQPAPLPSESLPPRYQLVDRFVEQVKGTQAVRMVYSDGLHSFSLVETARNSRSRASAADTPRKGDDPSCRDMQVFDTTVHILSSTEASVVQWCDADRFYALMGSLPESDLVSLARSLILSLHPPAPAPEPPPPPTFGQTVNRGWHRLLRWLGLA